MLCLRNLWVLVYRGDFLELVNKMIINIQCSSYLIFKRTGHLQSIFWRKKMSNNDTGYPCGYHYFVKTVDKEYFLLENLMNFIEWAVCQKWGKLFSIYCRTNFQVFAEIYTFWDFFRCWETENYTIIIYVISIDKNSKFFLAVFHSSFIFHHQW